jgi:plastocyanin
MMIKVGKGGKMAIAGNSKTHTIKITVDNDGDFTYDNPLIWAYPGDTIIWECTNHRPFAIHIGWNSPLEKGRFQSAKGDRIETVVPEGAQPGNYEYTVAVDLNGNIWTDDPPFIVKPPKGSGG